MFYFTCDRSFTCTVQDTDSADGAGMESGRRPTGPNNRTHNGHIEVNYRTKISITGDVKAKYQNVALRAISAMKRTPARYRNAMSHPLFVYCKHNRYETLIHLNTVTQ